MGKYMYFLCLCVCLHMHNAPPRCLQREQPLNIAGGVLLNTPSPLNKWLNLTVRDSRKETETGKVTDFLRAVLKILQPLITSVYVHASTLEG